MIYRETSAGFTIIEIMIVIAISALMASTIVIWQGSINSQARFDDALDTLYARIDQERTQVSAVVNESVDRGCADQEGVPTGTNRDCILFGKALIFNEGSDTVDVRHLIAHIEGDLSTENIVSISTVGSLDTTFSLKWGVEFQGAQRDGSAVDTIVLVRSFDTSSLHIYTLANGSTSITDLDSYTETARNQSATFQLASPEGATGQLHVNESSSSLRRSFE